MRTAGRIVRYSIFAVLALIVLIAVVGVTGFIVRRGGGWALAQWQGPSITTSASAPAVSSASSTSRAAASSSSASGAIAKDLGMCRWNGGCDASIPSSVPQNSTIYMQGDIGADGRCGWAYWHSGLDVPKPNATVRYVLISGANKSARESEAERRGANACQ